MSVDSSMRIEKALSRSSSFNSSEKAELRTSQCCCLRSVELHILKDGPLPLLFHDLTDMVYGAE